MANSERTEVLVTPYKGSQVRILSARRCERPAQLAFFIFFRECLRIFTTRIFARTRVRFAMLSLVVSFLRTTGECGSGSFGAHRPRENGVDQVFLSVVRTMSDTEAIVQDPVTGSFGFRLEMGRDHGGTRMQARRTGFATARAATIEYDQLCRQRDARHPKPRLSDSAQNICEDWVLAREQELEPNTVYGYRWLFSLIYPYVGGVRASRLSARMVERAYRELEGCGYSRTALRTLNLVLAKAFVEQVGRSLGARERQRATGVVARRGAAFRRPRRG